jgi:hypothetical protein
MSAIWKAESLLDVMLVTDLPRVTLSARRESDHKLRHLRSIFCLIKSQETTSCNSITLQEEQENLQNGARGAMRETRDAYRVSVWKPGGKEIIWNI